MALKNIGIGKASELFRNFFVGEKSASDTILSDKEGREAVKESFEKEIIMDMKNKYEERRTARLPLELVWRLCVNYYNGNQFVRIDPLMNDIVETPLFSPWEERGVFNEIAPNIETRFAILSKRKNNLKTRPASSSSEDRTSAKISNKVLASVRRRLSMTDLQQEANLISGTMGSAVWKTGWSTSKGNVVGIIESEADEEDIQALTVAEYERELLGLGEYKVTQVIREGDVMTTLHSPFEIYPENISKPCRDNRRIMHVALLSPEEVFEKWGVIEEGKENTTFKILDSENLGYGGGISGRSYGQIYGITKINNSVMVFEETELPSPAYPNGRLIICTENNLLYYGPMPEPLGENGEYIQPYDVQQSLKTDGFFGRSFIERMVPLQDRYNAIKNRKQDYINRLTIGVLAVEDGALTDREYYLENGISPGDIIEYRAGSRPPEYMRMDDLPEELYREEQSLLSALDRFSGVSQLSKQSVVPTNVVSGVAIAGLAEQDDTRIGLEAENIKNCLTSVGKKWLVLYRNNVKYPRIVKDLGRNDEFEIVQFTGNSLTSFDVFVESEPEASDTLSQRRQKVVELLQSGLFNDTETGNITNEGRIKVFEMLELGNWEDFVDSDDAQARKAERENNAMTIAQPVKIREFDDDVIHNSKHNNFRLYPEYEEALQQKPEIDQLFEAHVNEHIESLRVKSMAEAQMQAPVEGSAQPIDADGITAFQGNAVS